MSVSEKYAAQWQLLQSAFLQDKLTHAYLLSGIMGVGKTAFSQRFAQFLLCEKKTGSESCGGCRSCQWIQAGTHPDFILIEPTEKKHTIKIDQIRELSDKLSRTAQQGGYQVVIISPADTMLIQAANALLKTLEEPTGKVILFLIDNQKSALPATIISRCQKIFFSFHEVDLRLYDHALTLHDQLLQHLYQIAQRRVNAINLNAAWLKIPLDDVLQQIILLCHNMTLVQCHVKQDRLIHYDVMSTMSVLAETIEAEHLQRFIQCCFEKKAMTATGIHLNAQLCLESLFIEWERLCL